jgi:acyl-homoserine lactone acylase PvdQ
MLTNGHKFDVDDFARMQQDTVSLPARDFLLILKDWHPAESGDAADVRAALLSWDCNVKMDSRAALIYEVWMEHLHRALLPKGIASTRLASDILISDLNTTADRDALFQQTLETSLAEIR